MVMLPNDTEDPEYKFVLGTNNGISILKINKGTLQMSVMKKNILPGVVVNNLLVRGKHIIAFLHDSAKYCLIDIKTKDVSEMTWLEERQTCCTGLQFAPDFHPDEMSIMFVRDESGVHMINTQTWHISTLINMAQGGDKFPDLSLLEVASTEDHRTLIFTMDKNDSVLVKRSYSNMLKYCLQTASIRSSCFKSEALRKKLH